MDTRRFRDRSEAVAAFRWLGWVMLMMFVLVQTARAAGGAGTAPIDAGRSQARELSQASARFDPGTRQVTVTAPAPAALWDVTPDIGAHSFVVYEDNVRQPLESVEVVHTPLSIGVLVEHGGRYHALNEALADAGLRALRELKAALNSDDRFTVWTYGATVDTLEEASNASMGLELTTAQIPVAPSSESNFYDAVLTVLPRMQQMAGRKALIVISSGIDTFSQADFAQVLRAAADGGVPVCPINIGPMVRPALPGGGDSNDAPYEHLKWQLASRRLSRLAQVSGCRASTPNFSLELPAAYDGLLANLRLRYVMRYRSTALDVPGTRAVRVEWTDEGKPAHDRLARTNIRGSGKVFADTRYTVDPVAMLVNPTTLTSPVLQSPSETEVAVPWMAANGDGPMDALLAATQPEELGRARLDRGRSLPFEQRRAARAC